MTGLVNPERPEPDVFCMQCTVRIKKDLQEMYMKTETRKRFKNWTYFSRFLPAFRVHKDLISTEEDLAKFLYEHYGYGIFGVMFRGNIKYFPQSRKKKWKKVWRGKMLRYGRRFIYQRRASVEIIEGYNPETGENFSFRFNEKYNEMSKMPFWKGKKNKVIKEDGNIQVSQPQKVDTQEIAKLGIE